jgi:hypothetical protein
MGVIGQQLGEVLGRALGGAGGTLLGKYTGMGANEGSMIGSDLSAKIGKLLPFKKGGRVKKTGKIMAHKGEFVLPKGVKPTKKQLKAVKKRGGRL